jgi:hypothetical protein
MTQHGALNNYNESRGVLLQPPSIRQWKKLFFLMALLCWGQYAFAQLFSTKTDLPLTASIGAMHNVFGDINSDGRPDIIIGNQNGNNISILLNTTTTNASSPSFAAQVNFASGTQCHAVAVADLNGDGLVDVAAANTSSATISVFLNTTAIGSSTPTLATKVDLVSATNPYGVVLKDINGDGKPDIIASGQTANMISVFINTTATGASIPSFSTKTDFATGTAPTHLCFADFNNDGLADIAVANNAAATVSVFLNTTALGASVPSFSTKTDFAAGSTAWSVIAADFNMDGLMDMAVANRGGATVSVFLNTTHAGFATPTFAAKTDFAVGSTPFGLTAGDVNNDGLPDLLVGARGAASVGVLLNTMAPGATTPVFGTRTDFTTASQPYFPILADINGDGKLDIAISTGTGNSISVLMSTSPAVASVPAIAGKTNFAGFGINSSAIVTGDINLDGRPDIVQGYESAAKVSVLLNTTALGGSSPNLSSRTDFTTAGASYGVSLADFNGDGKPDMVATGFATASVSVLMNTTVAGAASPAFSAKTDFTVGTSPVSVAIGDFNGDGRPDMVTANAASASVSVLLNSTAAGAATPSFTAATNFGTAANPYSLTVKDFNSDGKPDIAVVSNSAAVVSILLNTTFAGASTPSFAAASDFSPVNGSYSVATGDFNGDGKPDLAVSNPIAGTVSVLMNTTVAGAATASFSAQADFNAGSSPRCVALVDVDLDGKLDIAVANQGSANFSILINSTIPGSPAASFAPAVNFAALTTPRAIANADINMDGRPDWVVSDYSSSSFSIMLNTLSIPVVWTGAGGTVWNTDGSWSTNLTPVSTDDVSIPTGLTNYPVLSTVQAVKNITVSSGASLTITGTLQIGGTISNNGTVTATAGTVEFNGSSAQTIPASTFSTNTVKNLIPNNAAGVNLVGSLNITGIVTPTAGTLTTGGFLTLKSSSITNTAQVGIVGGDISGNVTVERHLPASNRAYRLLAPGVTTASTINANWQEGVNVTSAAAYPNAGGTATNPNTGYGTHITGSTTGINGFDATVSGAPSLYTFNNTTQAWAGVANTNLNTLSASTPYRILIRGSRSADLRINAPTVTATTLRATGAMTTGAVSYDAALSQVNGQYSFVANPYWAAVDWTALSRTNIGSTYWIWDPTIAGTNGRGGYTSFTRTGAGTGTTSGGGAINKNIQPGQAFFVLNTAASPILGFAESNKDVATALTSTFRGSNQTTGVEGTIAVRLFLPQYVNDGWMADAATIAFRNDFAKTDDAFDAPKLANPDENISFKVGTKLLGMDALPMPANDTVQLNMGSMLGKKYVLQLEGAGFAAPINMDAFLLDNYKNQKTAIDLNGTINIDYEIDGHAASANADRFMIVFGKKAPLPMPISSSFSISLSPNPASNILTIACTGLNEKESSSIRICNATGKLVRTIELGKLQTARQAIGISSLSNGMYTVQLLNGETKQTQTFIKQ